MAASRAHACRLWIQGDHLCYTNLSSRSKLVKTVALEEVSEVQMGAASEAFARQGVAVVEWGLARDSYSTAEYLGLDATYFQLQPKWSRNATVAECAATGAMDDCPWHLDADDVRVGRLGQVVRLEWLLPQPDALKVAVPRAELHVGVLAVGEQRDLAGGLCARVPREGRHLRLPVQLKRDLRGERHLLGFCWFL